MIKRITFDRNSYYSKIKYATFMKEVSDFVNSGVDIISINELSDEHYNHSIIVWYKEKSSIKETG